MSTRRVDPKRPLLDQAVPKHLAPLPLADVGEYVAERFEKTGRNVGSALTPMLEFTRDHPQRIMMLAHYLWRRTARGATADEDICGAALDQADADSAPVMRAIWRSLPANEPTHGARDPGDHHTSLQRGDSHSRRDQARQASGEQSRPC
jgi:hypothetical protein